MSKTHLPRSICSSNTWSSQHIVLGVPTAVSLAAAFPFYIPNCWKHFYIQFLLETGPKQETAVPKSTELSPDTHCFQFDTWKVKFEIKKL